MAATAAAAPAPAKGAGVRLAGITLNHSSNMIFLTQVAMTCLYGGCTVFDGSYSNAGGNSNADNLTGVSAYTHLFIALFVFLGFGFLFIQNGRNQIGNLAIPLAIAATTVEWAILMIGFWDNGRLTRTLNPTGWPPIPLNLTILLNALYIAATILVSYGAVAGRVSFGQAYGLAFFEVFFATAAFCIMQELRVNDYGGTMYIHFFGATFGLFASLALWSKSSAPVNAPREPENAFFGLIGTVLIFVLYPIFNVGNVGYVISRNTNAIVTASVLGTFSVRGYFNTAVAVASSVAGAYMVSRANSRNGSHFTVWQIQTAAIAGGAAISATAPMLRNPWGAIMTGAVVGTLSVIAQTSITPLLEKCRMVDATGVFATHWIPGFIGIFASAIAVARVTENEEFSVTQRAAFVPDGRTAVNQGGHQCAYGLILFGLALAGGLFTGLMLNLGIFEPRTSTVPADDNEEFEGLTTSAVAPTVAANPVAKADTHTAAAPAAAAPAAVEPAEAAPAAAGAV